MNSTHGLDKPSADDFDQHVRALHAQALDNVSARTQAQLAQRRRAARNARPRNNARAAWPFAAAFATVCALAIGLPFRHGVLPVPATSPAGLAVVSADLPATDAPTTDTPLADSIPDDSIDASATLLDEDPELYLWLASSDAVTLASE